MLEPSEPARPSFTAGEEPLLPLITFVSVPIKLTIRRTIISLREINKGGCYLRSREIYFKKVKFVLDIDIKYKVARQNVMYTIHFCTFYSRGD